MAEKRDSDRFKTIVDRPENIRKEMDTLRGVGETTINTSQSASAKDTIDLYVENVQSEVEDALKFILKEKLNDPNYVAEQYLSLAQKGFFNTLGIDIIKKLISYLKSPLESTGHRFDFDSLDEKFFVVIKSNPGLMLDLLYEHAKHGNVPELGYRIRLLKLFGSMVETPEIKAKLVNFDNDIRDIYEIFSRIQAFKKNFSIANSVKNIEQELLSKYGNAKIIEPFAEQLNTAITVLVRTKDNNDIGIVLITDTSGHSKFLNTLFGYIPEESDFIRTIVPGLINFRAFTSNDYDKAIIRKGYAVAVKIQTEQDDNSESEEKKAASLLGQLKNGIIDALGNKK